MLAEGALPVPAVAMLLRPASASCCHVSKTRVPARGALPVPVKTRVPANPACQLLPC